MARDSKLGDKMPDTRDPKWGSMVAGKSHLSDEYSDMVSTGDDGKWYELNSSLPRMSEKWVDVATEGELNPQWNELKQDKRDDPYQMAPSDGKRPQPFKESKNAKPNTRVSRSTQHTEFGSTREI